MITNLCHGFFCFIVSHWAVLYKLEQLWSCTYRVSGADPLSCCSEFLGHGRTRPWLLISVYVWNWFFLHFLRGRECDFKLCSFNGLGKMRWHLLIRYSAYELWQAQGYTCNIQYDTTVFDPDISVSVENYKHQDLNQGYVRSSTLF